MWEEERAVIAEVAAEHRLKPEDLTGPSRKRPILTARYAAAHRLKDRRLTLGAVGMLLGGRHHSTIINGLRR